MRKGGIQVKDESLHNLHCIRKYMRVLREATLSGCIWCRGRLLAKMGKKDMWSTRNVEPYSH